MTSCIDSIHKINLDHAQSNAEFLPYLFSDINCQGVRYPPEKSFPLWDQEIERSFLNLNNIGSIFIPHHTELQLFSKDDSMLTIHGPVLISNTNGYIKFWHMPDDQLDCVSTFSSCGNKVNWSFIKNQDGSSNPQSNQFSIDRILFHRTNTWHDVLHDLAVIRQQLKINHASKSYTYEHDFDDFIENVCPDKRYGCNCHDHYLELKNKHGDVSQLYVNLLNSKCDHQKEYVHSSINVGKGTKEECMSMFRFQIENKTFDFKDKNGFDVINCAGHTFENTNDNQSKLVKKGTSDISLSLLICILVLTLLISLFYIYLLKKSNSFNKHLKIHNNNKT
jgi:hypothetical protein